MTERLLGHNAKRVMIMRFAMLAIPPGSSDPLGTGLSVLTDSARMKLLMQEASQWTQDAIDALKATREYRGWDDETLAGILLSMTEDKMSGDRDGDGHQ